MTVTNAMPGCAVSYRLSPARSPAQPKGDVMSVAPRRFSDLCRGAIVFIVIAAGLFWSPPTLTAEPSDIESGGTVVHTVRPRQSPAPGCPLLAWRKPAVPIARGGAGDAESCSRALGMSRVDPCQRRW